MDRIAKLREAAALVCEVINDLNTNEKMCDMCGHRVYENWDDVQASDQLNAAAHKIAKWADLFKRKAT
jgi:hypothetical protein